MPEHRAKSLDGLDMARVCISKHRRAALSNRADLGQNNIILPYFTLPITSTELTEREEEVKVVDMPMVALDQSAERWRIASHT